MLDYIYLPTLFEKYALLNNIILDTLTIEEAQALSSSHISIASSDRNYDHCIEIKTIGDGNGTDPKQYYCYNDKQQLLDHVLVGKDNHIQILEGL